MRYSTQIKPISYLKANAASILDELSETQNAMIITKNGEARAVLQDVVSYEKTQETLALLRLLAMGERQIAAGQIVPARDVIERLKARSTDDDA